MAPERVCDESAGGPRVPALIGAELRTGRCWGALWSLGARAILPASDRWPRPLGRGRITTEAITDTDYATAARLLEASALSPSPSEAHGILCGLICGGDADPALTWLDLLQLQDAQPDAPADLLAPSIRAGLDALAAATLEDIHGPGIGFELLLPDDSRPLVERATGVYDWVRGFLFALGVQGIGEEDLGSETREIFRDFTDLTHMDLGALGASSADGGAIDEEEDALTEITEFLWVAAMLVYEERVTAPRERGPKAPDPNNP